MFGTKTLVALAKKRPGGTCCGQDEDGLRSVKTTSGLSDKGSDIVRENSDRKGACRDGGSGLGGRFVVLMTAHRWISIGCGRTKPLADFPPKILSTPATAAPIGTHATYNRDHGPGGLGECCIHKRKKSVAVMSRHQK